MGLQKDARVTIGVDGGQEVARALGTVSESVQGIVSDLGHVVTAAGAISFAGAIGQVHTLEESVARIGVGAGRSFGSVQAGVNELARGIGELPQELAAWTSSVGRLTHSFEGAAQAAKGMREYAALTGETFQEVQPLAVALQTVGHVAGDTSRAVGVIAAQAARLGTVGGPQAIGDAFVRLQGQISQLANSEDTSKITALLAGFGGKGLTAPQRERALGAVVSRVEANPEGFERFLGHSITDEYGHIKDVTGILRELAQYGQRGRGQQKRLLFTFGAEGAAALARTDFGAIRDAERVEPTTAAAEAQARLQQSPAGQRRQAKVQKDIAMQGLVGHDSLLGGLSDAFGRFAGEHPLGALVGVTVGTKLTGAVLKGGAGLLKGFGAATGAGTAATGGASAAGGETVAAGGEALLGTGALSGFSATSAGEGVVALGGAGAGLAGAAGGGLLGSGFLLYKYLRAMALANSRKWGFGVRDIPAGEAQQLASQEQAAEVAAPAARSPGMQAAYEAERARLEHQRSRRSEARVSPPSSAASAVAHATAPQSQAALAPLPASAAPSTTDALYKSTVEQLVKAGASLALAQETAAAVLRDQRTPVQITVINATGGSVDAQVRGEQ